MDLLHIVLVVLIGAGAGFVQRVSGFGLGIFAMLFLPHFMSSHTAAAAISSLFSCATSSYNSVIYRKHINYAIVWPMIVASLFSIPIAVRFSAAVSTDIFKLLLGAVLVFLSLYFIFLNKNIRMKPSILNGVVAGALGGTLGGLFSTGGPPAVLYLSSATKDNITYLATIQFYFCFTNLYSTLMRVKNGIINTDVLLYAAIGMIGCLVGDFIGKKIFNRLDSDKLKSIIYIGMLISGVIMFF